MKQIVKTSINIRTPIKYLSKDWRMHATFLIYNGIRYLRLPMTTFMDTRSTGMNLSSSQNWKENQSKSIRYF